MFRKIMAVSAIAALMALSACNSITGPVPGTSNRSDGRPAPRPPQELEKVCLEGRETPIVSPDPGQLLYGYDVVMFQWDTHQACGDFTAELFISTDGGATFTSLGQSAGASSALWQVPNIDTAANSVVAEVVIVDRMGYVSSDLTFADGIRAKHASGRNGRPPQEHD